MTDIVAQFVRIVLRYLAGYLILKGYDNEVVGNLFQNEATVELITGLLIAGLTEIAWIKSKVIGVLK